MFHCIQFFNVTLPYFMRKFNFENSLSYNWYHSVGCLNILVCFLLLNGTYVNYILCMIKLDFGLVVNYIVRLSLDQIIRP